MTTPAPRSSAAAPRSRLPLTIGLMAFAGGVYLLLGSLGLSLPPFKEMWPLFLLLGAVASAIDFFMLSKSPRSAGGAVTFLGFGVLGFAVTLDYTTWGRFLDWLPSFPTIFGLGFLTTWLAGGRRESGTMLAGLVLLALGLMGYAARFDVLQRIIPSAQIIWAFVLLLGGGLLIWKTVARR